MKLDREMVATRIREAQQPTYQASELCNTIDLLAARLWPEDHMAHSRRIDEAKRFIRQHYGIQRQIDTTLIDFGALCFLAGIHEADGEPYESGNARVDAVLVQVRTRLTRTATPEGESLQRTVESKRGERSE